jgi:hypothetical protein
MVNKLYLRHEQWLQREKSRVHFSGPGFVRVLMSEAHKWVV